MYCLRTLDHVFETSRFGFSTRILVAWCFPLRELLRKQELVVDRGQLLSLFTVHWGGIFHYVHGFLHFSFGPLWLSGKHFGVVKWNRVSGGIAVVTNTGWYGQVGVFLEAFSKGRFVSPMYTCAGCWSHVISYMTLHLLSFSFLSFGCTRMEHRVFTGLWYTRVHGWNQTRFPAFHLKCPAFFAYFELEEMRSVQCQVELRRRGNHLPVLVNANSLCKIVKMLCVLPLRRCTKVPAAPPIGVKSTNSRFFVSSVPLFCSLMLTPMKVNKQFTPQYHIHDNFTTCTVTSATRSTYIYLGYRHNHVDMQRSSYRYFVFQMSDDI